MKEIPEKYRTPAEKPGTLLRFEYDTPAERKPANVYLPHGYSPENRYDIIYMMHGGYDSLDTFFGSPDKPNDMKNVVDHLVGNGEIRPVILVAPTFYPNKGLPENDDGWDAVRAFPDELVKYLMPAVEAKYSTYAKTADEAGFSVSRAHRAFGGFSMGGLTTWYVMEYCLRFFEKLIPLSGDCWTAVKFGGSAKPVETAAMLSDAIKAQGFSAKDYTVYVVTGSEDIAEKNLTPMIECMRKHPDCFGDNLTYLIKDGATHYMGFVEHYLYNALLTLFPAEK